MIKNKEITSKENNNANLTFVSTILTSIFGMITGFIIVKLTISFYGEPMNGIMRFILQIFAYTSLAFNSLSMVFSIQIIKFYKNNQHMHMKWINKYMIKIWYTFSIFYFIIVICIGIVVSKILNSPNISSLFIFLLFLSISLGSLLNIIFAQRYDIYFSSINKGYIARFITLIANSFLFSYFILVSLLATPVLHKIYSNEGIIIETFKKGDIRVYNLAIAYLGYSLSPIITGATMYFIYKKYYKIHDNTHPEINEFQKAIIKKELWKNLKFSIILSISGLIISNTDEFVMMLLKTSYGGDHILKIIGIYGLYISIILNIYNLLANYIISKKVLIGLTPTHSDKRDEFMQKLKMDVYILSAIFCLICIFGAPLIINTFFNPTSDTNLYLDTNFSIPVTLLFALALIYWPDFLLLEVDNKFKQISIISIIEGIINIVLSVSLIMILGIYWVIWASIIARVCKIILLKHMIIKLKVYINPFRLSSNIKRILLLLLLLLLCIIEISVLYIIGLPSLINFLNSIIIWVFLICILIFYSRLLMLNHKKR